MIVKDINECDFVNYKKPSMFIAFPKCTFKCDRLNQCQCCQNSELAKEPDIEITKEEICERYLDNPLTSAIVLGGLEPFDTELDMLSFINCLRAKYHCNDDIVIYTGYTKEELEEGWRDGYGCTSTEVNLWDSLKEYPNIIVKYGRFLLNDTSVFDPVLGIKLASHNQYAEVISNEFNENQKES